MFSRHSQITVDSQHSSGYKILRRKKTPPAKRKAPPPTGRNLASLAPGDGGVILVTPLHHERLAEIGLVKGERVEVVQVAPLGDPVILQVLDAPVIVRRADLEGVLVV
jgi:Fe2+ transport system protein FeoA